MRKVYNMISGILLRVEVCNCLIVIAMVIRGCAYTKYLPYCGICLFSGVTVLAMSIFSMATMTEKNKKLLKPLDAPVDANHGDNLADFMENVRNEEFEYIAIFSRNGKVAEKTLLSPIRCEITAEVFQEMKEIEATEVHNHPEPSRFSPADIVGMLCRNSRRSIVVTAEYNYILENPHWKADRKIGIRDVIKIYLHINFIYLSWGLISSLISSKLYSRVVPRVAKKYRLNYYEEPIKSTK